MKINFWIERKNLWCQFCKNLWTFLIFCLNLKRCFWWKHSFIVTVEGTDLRVFCRIELYKGYDDFITGDQINDLNIMTSLVFLLLRTLVIYMNDELDSLVSCVKFAPHFFIFIIHDYCVIYWLPFETLLLNSFLL